MINYLEPDFCDHPGRRIVSCTYNRCTADCRAPAVSIVTPYYNTEAFFIETYASLQAQSLQNWEWVIVDDGSSDEDSVERLAKLAATDPRIKVIRQSNAGPAAARNTAFHNTGGSYICLLDSDDMVEPTYLEKCVWFLESNPEFAFCNSYSVVFGDQNYLWTTGFERGRAHLQANSGPPISVIRRSAYEDCGGFDESIRFGHEDWDFWLAMASAGHWGYTIREFLQWYRKRGSGRFEQVMKTEGVNDEFEELMRTKYAGLEKRFPEPSRRHPAPYDSVETRIPVFNPLVATSTGRQIMFIVPWMVTGGADRVNLDLIEGLRARGHGVTVCATLATDHRWEHEFARLTSDIFVLPNFLRASDYPRFLAYVIESRKVDTVVITGSSLGYQCLPYLKALSPEVAFVDMCHVEEPHWLNGGHPRFGVGYQDLLDQNITTTAHLAEWMQGRGADESRIKVMYTGVRAVQPSSKNRENVRFELDLDDDIPLIVFAGRICEQKRPAMLAEILRCVREQGALFRAVIIGDGELRDQLANLLAEYRLTDQVQLLGSVSHRRWLEILAASDVLLMPSAYEGISIALLEALASGVVPVVAKVGGQDEIVSADAGMLISQGGEELEEYVAALLRLLTDCSTLRQMSTRCKTIASSKLSWDGMIDRFLSILDEAHRFRLTTPRNAITPQLGRELVAQALECKRLGEAVDWLWNATPKSTSSESDMLRVSAEALAVAKFAIALSQTWFGRKLIRNDVVRAFGRYVLQRLGAPSRA
ncbi:putative glycosyltransferase EpsH [Azoarcus sp. Aa7]|nr:putative glycosyltransferase EpsH [Azoarcus sp. Aa7]